MVTVLIATDADAAADEVVAALGDRDTEVVRVRRGADVLPTVRERTVDLVVLDLQIGNMGGVATCLSLRAEEGAGRLEPRPVLMLLDRVADVFLAKRSDSDGWLVKPLDSFRLRRAAEALLAGGSYHEGSEAEAGGDALPENVVVPDQATPDNPAEPEHHAPTAAALTHSTTDASDRVDAEDR